MEEGVGKNLMIHLASLRAPYTYLFTGISAIGGVLLSTLCVEFKRSITLSNIIAPT